MITTSRTAIVAGAPPVTIYVAAANVSVTLFSDGGGVYIGGSSGVSPATGFQLTNLTLPLALKTGDRLWAVATSQTNLSLIVIT